VRDWKQPPNNHKVRWPGTKTVFAVAATVLLATGNVAATTPKVAFASGGIKPAIALPIGTPDAILVACAIIGSTNLHDANSSVPTDYTGCQKLPNRVSGLQYQIRQPERFW